MASPAKQMTLHIPSGNTSDPAQMTARQYIDEGDGFTLIFKLPYKRQDVFAELIAEQQLGVDHSNITISVTRPGDETSKPTGSALSQGCERTVNFPDGKVVSELVELTWPSMIKWRQLTSQRDTNMVGKAEGELPTVAIALDELADGTSIRMTYDFYQIQHKDGSVLDGPQMSKLLAQATAGWGADMERRGYKASMAGSGDGATPRGSLPNATVVRAAGQVQKDRADEDSMKAEMMAKARAAAGS